MTKILPFLMKQGRLFFAFCFLTPLFAQIMVRFEIVPPLGLSPLLAAAILAGILGVTAKVRGRWI